MDNREFLKKIRDLQKSGEKIKLTESSDIFDKTLDSKSYNRLLESYLKPVISEDFEPSSKSDYEVEEQREEGQDISAEEQREEENAFKDKVSQLSEFEKIKVYTKTVTWSGRLIREGINWSYTLDDKIGCFINTDEDDTLQLTDDMLKVIKSIRAYYDIWSDEWGSRLTGGPSGGSEI